MEKTKKGKEGVISSERVNCYGSRVLTLGIDTEQYKRNPVLLYMHNRYGRDNMPIGYIEDIRVDNNMLLGSPVFDMEDEDAVKIAKKWEKGVLRMMSPSLEPIATSNDPSLILQGQWRETVTKCKLIEVSIVDIGGNDDALQLQFEQGGKVIELSREDKSDVVPLLELRQEETENKEENKSDEKENKDNKKETNVELKKERKMNEETLLSLGLPADATNEQISEALARLKKENEELQLSAITDAVGQAKAQGKITEQAVSHFVELGKKIGLTELKKTLDNMSVVVKPTDLIDLSKSRQDNTESLKWADLTPDKAEELKLSDRKKYIELYKAEFGFEPNL